MPTVLVFGGSGAIGSAVCLAFARQGYSVAFTYFKNKNQAQTLQNKLEKYSNCPAMAIYCDASSEDSIQEVLSLPIYFNIVVNCVGIALYKEIFESTLQDYNAVFASNFLPTYLITKLTAQKMITRSIEGSIIHISSIWGNVGASCESLYAATKGAVNAFTKSAAKELATSKIRVNAIASGMVKSKMNAKFTDLEVAAFFKNAPIVTIGEPEDTAAAVLFLADSKYITGEILVVDGGVTLN